MSKKGLIIINTGNGKGKTTAALGQALRAVGHRKRILFIQFIKGSWKYGELTSIEQYKKYVDFHVMGKGFTFKSENLEEDRLIAEKGWALATDALSNDTYFMVILDEFTYLLKYHFLNLNDVLTTLKNKRKDLHVIITGRDAPEELIDISDMATEMRVIKHPLKNGIKAQKGIEF